MHIKADHLAAGLQKPHVAWSNHTSTLTLLHVPSHDDLLGDQDDEDESECGRLLVMLRASQRVEMALWMKKVQDEEEAEKLDERDEVLQGLETRCHTSTKWKHISLKTLFGGTKPVPMHLLQTMEEEEEAAMMQAMAEVDEDKRPDDGEMEIPSEDEYH